MGYRGKIEAQNRARDLRAQGWTYKEICDELGVSRSSVSAWVRDVEFDRAAWEARARANYVNGNFGPRPKRQNRLQIDKHLEIARLKAQGAVRIGRLTEKEFLVAGVALYAGEGAKTGTEVKFANSDPRMQLFFVTWLRRFWPIDERRLRVQLYLHEGLDLEAALDFWSELLAIPRRQMIKPYRAIPDASIRRAKHAMGCPGVYYCSVSVLRSVLGLSDALLACSDSLPG
ncbi:MAG: helix-turn-helix domain-containing protein [Acidimicrobiia bacterium]|nr:helix-turn-helix domain-containing protein [Acidimicrobiia bacterium]